MLDSQYVGAGKQIKFSAIANKYTKTLSHPTGLASTPFIAPLKTTLMHKQEAEIIKTLNIVTENHSQYRLIFQHRPHVCTLRLPGPEEVC
jgi:hypothetical protein